MKALELAKWLDDFHGADSQFPSKAAQDAASELRRLAEVNEELLAELAVARSALADFAGLTEPHAHSLASRFAEDIAKVKGGAS